MNETVELLREQLRGCIAERDSLAEKVEELRADLSEALDRLL